ncbi:MAG: O-antigen ligase family protein [Patescibacteria group bacterium]|nr:O-antigen ligase family protein [Patescibacteria group bacterium]
MKNTLFKFRRTADPVSDTLYWIILVGVGVTLFLPLVVGGKFFFPFIVLKNVLFRVVVEILAVAYVAFALRDPRFRPRWNPLIIAVLTYFGVVTLTSFTGIEPVWSFWGNYERMGGLFSLWHLAAYFFILVNTFRRWEDWQMLLTFSVFVCVVEATFSFGQWLQVPFLLKSSGGARLTGTIGNATYLAAYLLFHLFLIGYFIVRDREFDVRLFFWSLVGMDISLVGFEIISRMSPDTVGLLTQLQSAPRLFALIIALHGAALAALMFKNQRLVTRGFLAALGLLNFFIFYQTQTRGAFIGLLGGLLVLSGLLAFFRRRTVTGWVSLAVVAVCILAPVALYLARGSSIVVNDPTLKRLASISLEDVTSQSRLDTWNASWQGWTGDPVRFLIGYGLEDYSQVFSRNFPSRIFKDQGSQIWFDRAHNIVFDVGITSGLLGLFSYLAIFALVAWSLWQTYRRHGDFFAPLVILALLVAYIFQNLFVFDTLDSFIMFHVILAVVVARAFVDAPAASTTPAEIRRPARYGTGQIIAVFGVGAVAFYCLVAFNYGLLVANNKIYDALLTFPKPDIPKQQQLFEESISGSMTGRFEARQQFATYALGLIGNQNVTPDQVRPVLRDALDELKKSVAEEPSNIRNHLYFASIANRASAVLNSTAQEVIAVLEPAIPLSPGRPQVYFELGQAYLMSGNTEHGIALYQQGLALSSQVVESNVDMALAYMLVRRPDDALRQLQTAEEQLHLTIPEDQYLRIIRAGERTEQSAPVAALYERLIAKYPPKSEWFVKLAAAYALIGEKDKALAAAKRALELDPSIQKDYDDFVKKLEETK